MCPLLPKVYVCLLLCSPPFTPIRLVTVVPACGGPAGRGFPLPWFSPPKPPLNSSCLFRLLSYLLLHPCHPPIRTLGLLWIPAISDRCSPISESPDPIHLLLNEPPILYDPLHVPYPGFLCRAQPSTFHQSMGVSYHVPPRYFAWALFLFSRPHSWSWLWLLQHFSLITCVRGSMHVPRFGHHLTRILLLLVPIFLGWSDSLPVIIIPCGPRLLAHPASTSAHHIR